MIKNIIFDFDGVIIDSMTVRDLGFKIILEKFSEDNINLLLDCHRLNGGLSRFNKIRYFYNEILKKEISDDEILQYSIKFTDVMKGELVKKQYLISDTVDYISRNSKQYNLHIASGSEQEELRFLCEKHGLKKYFKSIHGSPEHKNILVKNIIINNNYLKEETILIGDSINDYQAADYNNIVFYGYNNTELKNISNNYITNFETDFIKN